MRTATDAIRDARGTIYGASPQSQNLPNRGPIKPTLVRRFRQRLRHLSDFNHRSFGVVVSRAVKFLRFLTAELEILEAQLERPSTQQANLRAIFEFNGAAWQDALDEGSPESASHPDRGPDAA